MSEQRLIDPIRQGLEPEAPLGGKVSIAAPVALKDALAMVDAWDPGFGFQLHQIARALREGLREALADKQTLADEVERQQAHTTEVYAKLAESKREHDALWLEHETLVYQIRQMGLPFPDAPDRYRSEPLTLEHALSLMDAWREDVERWGLHQMCRVLREAYEDRTKDTIGVQSKLIDANFALFEAREALSDLQRTFDLRWDADRRAIKRWQEAHPGNDLVWPDRADMVVWLLDELESRTARRPPEFIALLRERQQQQREDAADLTRLEKECNSWFRRWERLDSGRKRALAAIPCMEERDDCHAPCHPYAPCCNLRVALLPGEPFHVEHLEDGVLHLFAPPGQACPRAPLKSAGCVALIGYESLDG